MADFEFIESHDTVPASIDYKYEFIGCKEWICKVSEGGKPYKAHTIEVGDAFMNTGPAIYAGTPYDEAHPYLLAEKLRVQAMSPDGTTWRCSIDYHTREPFTEGEANPLNEPVKRSVTQVKIQEACQYDAYGYPIRASNGLPIMGLTRDRSMHVLTFTRNEPYYWDGLASMYEDCVNADWWYGYYPGTVKVISITGEDHFHTSVATADHKFWTVSYVFQVNPWGWNPEWILDAAKVEWDNTNQMYVPILINGVPVTDPWPLDQNTGKALTQQQVQAGAAYWIQVDKYPECNFSDFNL